MTVDHEIDIYLQSFDREAAVLPVAERARLRRTIVEHIEDGRAAQELPSDILRDLGDPASLVAAASTEPPRSRGDLTRVITILVEVLFGWAFIALGLPALAIGGISAGFSVWFAWAGLAAVLIGGAIVFLMRRVRRRAR